MKKISVEFGLEIFLFVLGTIIAIIFLGLVIDAYKNQQIKTIKLLRILSISHIICWILHFILEIFDRIYYIFYGKLKYGSIHYKIFIICLFFTSSFAELSLYTFMLLRLYFTFKQSIYKINYIILIILFIGICISSIGLFIGYTGSDINIFNLQTNNMDNKIIFISNVLSFIIGIIILFIFTKYLLKLMQSLSIVTQDKKFNNKKLILLNLSIKMVLLSFIRYYILFCLTHL